MIIVRTIAEMRAQRRALRRRADGARVAFVPTMGALHDGHVALFHAACAEADAVVASVFVNPTQFNDPADLAAYPRQESADAEIADAAGVDVLFVPTADEMYPAGGALTLTVGGAALGFEGDHRPGHFDGVATICLKLFAIVGADVVLLGQKDAQQVAVLRQLVRDTGLGVPIVAVPTVREAGELARSSRNVRLSSEDRVAALAIPRALRAAVAAWRAGKDPVAAARGELDGLRVDYADVAVFEGEPTLVVAAWAGRTRLIDNVPLNRPDLAGLA
jgi:pantoate--beta-alanine ligase